MTVGEKIRQQRITIGLSQAQLAEKLHISRAAVAKWENDNGLPDVVNLKALADFFHTDVDTLLDETKNLSLRQNMEYVDLEEYPVTGRCRNSFDAVMLNKFPDAYYISPATLVYEFNKAQMTVIMLPYRTQNIMREFYVGNRKFLDIGYDLTKSKTE